MNVYPIFLNNLAGRRCVVVGGGHEAERKAKGLLACYAAVVVIAPSVTPQLQGWAEEGRLSWLARTYQPGDLSDAFLAIVSEVDPERTALIWQEAQAEKVLLNAMDDIPHCTFVAGSVVRRGPLTLSISTSGCAPTLAVRLRQRLEGELGPEYETFLELMRSLREPMAVHFPSFEERRKRWYMLVDSDIIDLLQKDDLDAAYQQIAAIVGEDVLHAVTVLPRGVMDA